MSSVSSDLNLSSRQSSTMARVDSSGLAANRYEVSGAAAGAVT